MMEAGQPIRDRLIAFGAQLVASNIHQARSVFPALFGNACLKIAASGYNCGMGNAIAGERNGDRDLRATQGNYGADVMARMAIFQQITAPRRQIQNRSAVSVSRRYRSLE